MFQKLNIVLPPLDLNRLRGNEINDWDDRFSGFTEYEIVDVEYFLDTCKDIVSFDIKPDYFNITIIEKSGASAPHTDVWPVALNFYLNVSNDEITTFYDNPSGHKIAVKEIPGLHGYDPNKLIAADTFCAKTNDCYLLNTHRPHSVSNRNNSSRTILRLIWFNNDFDTILNSIKINTAFV